ncbi:alcohol dehydrogenase [Ectopseudomonas mendocina DLHK]|nr:alcohol dehydrogenase [Pseudomonas mendocina DLHK]
MSLPDARQAEMVGAFGKHFATRSDGAQLQQIAEQFDAGELMIEIEILTLSQAESALRKSLERHTRGKLVLDARH